MNFDFWGYVGILVFGSVKVGECIKVLLFGVEFSVVCIVIFDGDKEEVCVGEVIILVFNDDIDISCGDLLLVVNEMLVFVWYVVIDVVWMVE